MSAGYRKVSGRIGIDQGDIFDSVKGALGNEELARVLADTKQFKVNTDRDSVGRAIHGEIEPFFELTTRGLQKPLKWRQ